MKILEPQSATLTNYEVYTHLENQQARYKARGRMGPGNLNTLVKELMLDFHAPPGPLGNTPLPYDSNTIPTLIERLRPYDLAKAEMLMLFNHRPTHISHLTYLLEEAEQRFPEEQTQWDIISIIAEVLGAPDLEAEKAAMEKNAKDARARKAADSARESARRVAREREAAAASGRATGS